MNATKALKGFSQVNAAKELKAFSQEIHNKGVKSFSQVNTAKELKAFSQAKYHADFSHDKLKNELLNPIL